LGMVAAAAVLSGPALVGELDAPFKPIALQ
jgi:hypothetical protein